MSFPKQSEIELPLLKVLHEFGGKSEPKKLYPKVAEKFPQLTDEDLTERLPSSPSTFRWLDGEAIAESMIRNGIGVVRRPVQLFDIDPEFFRFPAADGFL